jgi:hypothetical protein
MSLIVSQPLAEMKRPSTPAKTPELSAGTR